MKHELPKLPFKKHDLEPFLSAETLEYHHGKHHRGYVEKLNELVEGTEFSHYTLEELIRKAPTGDLFNQAAQVWNHNFYWNSLAPGGSRPSPELRDALRRDFGSIESFLSKFRSEAMGVFGSGWIWLVRRSDDGKLAIETTPNAQNPLVSGNVPLLVCDLWEHAYYVDFRNQRAQYLDGFQGVANWEFASRNLEAVRQLAAA